MCNLHYKLWIFTHWWILTDAFYQAVNDSHFFPKYWDWDFEAWVWVWSVLAEVKQNHWDWNFSAAAISHLLTGKLRGSQTVNSGVWRGAENESG